MLHLRGMLYTNNSDKAAAAGPVLVFLHRGAMMTTFTYVFGDLAVMALLHFIANLLNRKREARKRDRCV